MREAAGEHPAFLTEHDRPLGLLALRITLGRAPLWLLTAAFTVLLALVAAAPWLAGMRQLLGQRYAPGALIRGLDEVFRFDTRLSRGALEASTSSSGAALALVAMLAGAFTAGGWLQVFLERTEGHSLRRFFYGGSRYYFRFLRVLLLTLLSLHLAGWLLYGKPWDVLVHGLLYGAPDGELEVLSSESTVRQIGWVQDGLYLALFALILVWGTYTRTRLALHDTSSAVWAGLCSWAMLVVHPVRTLRPMLVLLALESAVLLGVGWLTQRVQAALGPPGYWTPVLALFGLTLLAILWRSIVRGASYHAALSVSARIVRPLARPDPWAESFGGPGGPRYPLGGDEYGVSL
jgi:hypothetical protein